jgi:two-component system chemotaxis response regulator CheY
MTSKKTVLIVDDANLVRLYYRSILQPAGFEVREAMNGVEALERLLEEPADLLIVDINMPQMDGLTFLKTLRQREYPSCATPALVTSTEAGEQDFIAARTAGANFYFVKPIEGEMLVDVASMMCGMPR